MEKTSTLRPIVKQAEDTAAKARARLRSTCTANWIYPLEPDEEYGLGSGPTRVYCDIHHSGSVLGTRAGLRNTEAT